VNANFGQGEEDEAEDVLRGASKLRAKVAALLQDR
jgi:hypothetical protein